MPGSLTSVDTPNDTVFNGSHRLTTSQGAKAGNWGYSHNYVVTDGNYTDGCEPGSRFWASLVLPHKPGSMMWIHRIQRTFLGER